MTVNQFMITDYTELLQLVDLAGCSCWPVWSGERWLHQKEKEAVPGIMLKKLKMMTL